MNYIDIEKGADGYPTIESCKKYEFAQYYFTYAVQRTFQDLFDDVNGIRTSMAKMWAHVALNLKDHGALLGYEIINEPFAGLIYTNIYRLMDADNVNL